MMALAVTLLAVLLIFTITGAVVWGGYLLISYVGRTWRQRKLAEKPLDRRL